MAFQSEKAIRRGTITHGLIVNLHHADGRYARDNGAVSRRFLNEMIRFSS